MSEKKVVSRTIAIALGIATLFLLACLVGAIVVCTSIINEKDQTIALLNSKIAEKESIIQAKNAQIQNLQSEKERLEKLKNVTDQIFYLNEPYDSYSAEWLGVWTPVATFQGTSFQERTPVFQISSLFYIWRLNYTHTGELQAYMHLQIVQVVGLNEIVIKEFHISGASESFSVYLFSYNVYSHNTYYIKMLDYEGIYSWRISIEQLET